MPQCCTLLYKRPLHPSSFIILLFIMWHQISVGSIHRRNYSTISPVPTMTSLRLSSIEFPQSRFRKNLITVEESTRLTTIKHIIYFLQPVGHPSQMRVIFPHFIFLQPLNLVITSKEVYSAHNLYNKNVRTTI